MATLPPILAAAPGPPAAPFAAEPAAPPPPDAERQAAEELAARWQPALRPADPCESWLLGQVAALAIVLDRCRDHAAALRIAEARRAALCWAEDRRAAAAKLAAALPRRPEEVAARLARTRHGAGLMIGRWEALGRILAEKGAWSDPQRRLALDLLGVPLDLRDRPATPLDPAPDGDAPGHLRALVAGELGRLRALAAGPLAELDAAERSAAERGLPPEGHAAPALAAVDRRERSAARRLQWCLSRLRKARPAPPCRDDPDPRQLDPAANAPSSPTPAGRCADVAATAFPLAGTPAPATFATGPAGARPGPLWSLDPPALRPAPGRDRVRAPIPGPGPDGAPPNRKARRAADARARRRRPRPGTPP